MTWRDVIKTLVCCAALLFFVFAVLWAYETNMEIRSLQDDMESLKTAQRPLVALQGKYVNIFAREDEVVIQTVKEGSN